MRIHAYAICWNEEKLLPFYLKHYTQFCDKITIYDNESTDRSVEIIKSFPNVELISWSSNNQIDEYLYLDIKNNCWKKDKDDADIAIVGDIDEFLYHPSIKKFFTEKLAEGFTIFSPEGYTMISELIPPHDMPLVTQVRSGVPCPSKSMAFSPRYIKDINYGVGAHSLSPVGDIKVCTGDLKFLHYTMLNEKYVLAKYARSKKRLSKSNLEHKYGIHYTFNPMDVSRSFYEILKGSTDVLCNYRINMGYKINKYTHFDDTPYKDEYQRPVYEFVKDIMKKNDFKNVLDIGCGSGYKLVNILGEYNTVGTELDPALTFVKNKYPDRKWLESNFVTEYTNPVDVVMASDVIEHLTYPDDLIIYMKKLGAKYIVISTPNADNTVGPPANFCHVREWTIPQFKEYILLYFKEEQISHHLFGNTQLICIKLNA